MTAKTGMAANAPQREAITSIEGPLRIIAGPGSGKTFTLVERIVHLLTAHQVTPNNLLVVTFTDKAARELVTRISNRLLELNKPINLNEMYLGTFHAVCLRILEEHREFTRLKRNFILMDQFDQQYFLYRRLHTYLSIENIEQVIGESQRQSRWVKVEKLLKRLNQVSEEALDPAALMSAPDEAIQVLGHCYARYLQQLEEENALDFATIQREALQLLKTQRTVRVALQNRLRYLMVDEYQDTNTVQEKILTLLAGKQPNLCVVGDDDQGLYRFRGATIRNILEFDRLVDSPCQQVTLTTNYRSHPRIVEFYNRWMNSQTWDVNGTTFRFPKTIKPADATFPDLPSVVTVSGEGATAWHQEVLAFLHALRDAGQLIDWNQVAFLFRSVKNPKVQALAQYLEKQGITVYSPRANQFFEREEVRLMLGALLYVFPQFSDIRQQDEGVQLGIWEYYDQACLGYFVTQLQQPEHAALLQWADSMAQRHRHLRDNTDYAFTGLFYQLLRFPLFRQFLSEDIKKGFQSNRPMRNLALLSRLLSKFEYLHHCSVLTTKHLKKNLRHLFNQFFNFLMKGGINEYEDEAEYAPSGCVSFLTIHQSKGLEFPVVLVGSLGVTPRNQHTELDKLLAQQYFSKPPFEPLEEIKKFDFWRLYYTAFSRAQNLLALTCAERRGRGRNTPSRYFVEHYQSLPSWRHTALKLSDLKLAPIKAVTLKREYAFTSHIRVFENCAQQYRFFKALEFAPIRTNPILFGTLVHQTIEDIHKCVLQGEDHQITTTQIEDWFENNYYYLTKRERAYLDPMAKQAAFEHILRYYRRQHNSWQIRAAEVDVSLVKDQYILTGSVDLVQGHGDTLEIVDFKSEKKPDINNSKDQEKLNRYRRQLEVYAHLVEQRSDPPAIVSRMHLYYTSDESGNPCISFDKNKQSVTQTIQHFDTIVNRIEQHDFTMGKRPDSLCQDCDMRHYCHG